MVAGGTGQIPPGAGAARAPPQAQRQFQREVQNTSLIITDLNIDNDFKGGKLHILLYPQMPPANAAELFKQALEVEEQELPGQMRRELERERGVLQGWL